MIVYNLIINQSLRELDEEDFDLHGIIYYL
jgi:hypothetical protein